MAALGAILFIVSAISIIYPLRFLMIPNRLVALVGVIISVAMVGAGAPEQAKTAATGSNEAKPFYTSSGGCMTDIYGDTKCSHSTEMSLFGSTSRSTSELKCGQNLVTLAYECKSESRTY